jgi:hypothetical protein
MKRNCWEFKCCGNGENCPAYTESRLDRKNSGTNAGRACWVVAGTLCSGEVQGVFAQKMSNCKECDFYRLVLQEEGPNYINAINLLSHLN